MRNAINWSLRIYACLFHFVLSAFLLGLGIIGSATGNRLDLAMLPWKGLQLSQALIALGVIGLLCVALAAFGILRFLLPLWALAVLILMIRGFYLDGYVFNGMSQFEGAGWLTFGALGAFLSSLAFFERPRTRV